MKKLSLSIGFELENVSPMLLQHINELDSHLADVFKLGGAVVIDQKFNIELEHAVKEKSLLKTIFECAYPDYTPYPLKVNGKDMIVHVHADNCIRGNDYPTIGTIQEIVELNLPLYARKDRIHQVLFYHRFIFVNIPHARNNKFWLQHGHQLQSCKTVSAMENLIDNIQVS